MKDYVYVEFLFSEEEYAIGLQMLSELGDDFKQIKVDLEWDYVDPSDGDFYRRVSGRINSEAASILKLKHAFLSERMRVSYISESLKDKYRQSR